MIKPNSALSLAASAEVTSSSPCLRTNALRIDFPELRWRLHTDLSSADTLSIEQNNQTRPHPASDSVRLCSPL